MSEEKIQKFIDTLESYNSDLNAFIRLFNLWTGLTADERGEIIDRKLHW